MLVFLAGLMLLLTAEDQCDQSRGNSDSENRHEQEVVPLSRLKNVVHVLLITFQVEAHTVALACRSAGHSAGAISPTV